MTGPDNTFSKDNAFLTCAIVFFQPQRSVLNKFLRMSFDRFALPVLVTGGKGKSIPQIK